MQHLALRILAAALWFLVFVVVAAVVIAIAYEFVRWQKDRAERSARLEELTARARRVE